MNGSHIESYNSRVLVVSSHFPPRQSAGVYRTVRFVRYLPELGWNVHVLTIDPAAYEDGATTDEGLLAKVPTCVTVHRTKATYPLQTLNRIRTMLTAGGPKQSNDSPKTNGKKSADQNGHASPRLWQRMKDAVTVPLMTPDRMIGWIRYAVRCGKRIIREHGIDVIYSSGPPWSNHVIGLKLKRKTGRPWVADFRDPWVGSDFRTHRRGDSWAGRKHRQLERETVHTADRVVVNTDRSRDDIAARYPDVSEDKFTVIPNGFDPADYEHLKTTSVKPRENENKLIIAHAGSFYGKRNLRGFLEALGNVCREGQLPAGRISVQLIGARRGSRQTEQRQIEQAGLNSVVELLPPVPHHACLARLAQADVLLLVQTDAPLCVPGKLFEYIALGKPVFTLAGDGATADLVRQENLGPCVDPDDIAGLERAVIETYERFAANTSLGTPSSSSHDRYNGRRLTADLDDLLCSVRETREPCLP